MSLNDDIFPLDFSTEPTAFRLRVQRSLTEALQQVTPGNGFAYDLSAGVFRGRTIFGADDPLPMVSILEEPIAPESDLAPLDGQASLSDYPLMVQGFVTDDMDNPTDPAHGLMADVKKRLIELKRDVSRDERVFRFGPKANTVTDISFGGGVVRPADDVSAVAYFWLRVSFELAEDHLRPYD